MKLANSCWIAAILLAVTSVAVESAGQTHVLVTRGPAWPRSARVDGYLARRVARAGGLTNAERIKRGLPLNPPVRRTPRAQPLHKRFDPAPPNAQASGSSARFRFVTCTFQTFTFFESYTLNTGSDQAAARAAVDQCAGLQAIDNGSATGQFIIRKSVTPGFECYTVTNADPAAAEICDDENFGIYAA